MEASGQRSGVRCNERPDAPHGFMRDASHSAGRYVCECESWEPPKNKPMTRDEWYASPPKKELTCVCGAVWEGEHMVHAPQKKEWVGLTDDEISYQARKEDHAVYFALGALWAEAKLREKNI